MSTKSNAPRRKACVECREQKVRCDVQQNQNPPNPCSRCLRMNLECKIVPTVTRNLRKTKAEMRHELESLRMNMHQSNAPASESSHAGSQSPSAPNAVPFGPLTSSTLPPTTTRPTVDVSLPLLGPRETQPGPHVSRTTSKVLGTYELSSNKIDDCFSLYFSDYHPLLPILDPDREPGEYYSLLPFLFWCIIITGSRRYEGDPTILLALASSVTELACTQIAIQAPPIQTIQGLLILCTWRLPVSSMFKDITHVLCGMAIQYATRIGLHVVGIGQDFSRTVLQKDQNREIERAKLWVYCVLVAARSSVAEGLPALVSNEFFNESDLEREGTMTYIPKELRFLQKVHRILQSAILSMVKADVKAVSPNDAVIRAFISAFDSDLAALAPSSPTKLELLELNCARIHILAYHFFTSSISPDVGALIRLYYLCCTTIQDATELDHVQRFATNSTSFTDRSLNLAAFSILKLHRSSLLRAHLDLAAGERTYHTAIQFSQKVRLKPDDLGARAAAIMSQLWTSNRIFRNQTGEVDSLRLRLRGRLSMSVTFDMLWYWREEFGKMQDPYRDETQQSSNQQVLPPDRQVNAFTLTSDPTGEAIPSADLSIPLNPVEDANSQLNYLSEADFMDFLFPNQYLNYDWSAN